MPNPDFPSWFAVGVVVQSHGSNGQRWLVTRVEIQVPNPEESIYEDPLEGGHYAIHLIPVLPDEEGADWDRTRGMSITLPSLNAFRYTGLVMTPSGIRQDGDVMDEYVSAHEGVDEPTEEQAALEGFPSYLTTPDRAPEPGYLARAVHDMFGTPEPGAPREAWDWRAHIDSLTRAGIDVSGLADDTTHNREPGRPTYRRDNGGRFAHEEGFQVPPRSDETPLGVYGGPGLHEMAVEDLTESDWETLSDEQLELLHGLFPEGPVPATGAQSIREAEDARILAELAQRDQGMFTPHPGLFEVVGPLRANNEGQPNPFRNDVANWAERNQAGIVREDQEVGTDDMIPPGEGERPVVRIGQDWVLGQPHAGVWRIFGYAGEPSPYQVQDRTTEWMMRNTTTQAWAYVGEGWLVDHGVRQMPPDPRHSQNVSTLGLPAVLLGQVWQIPLGRRKRAPGRPVNFRVKEIKGDQVMLLSEEKNSGQRVYTTIAKLTGEGTLIGDGTPRRTAYERLLADDDVLDEE